MAITTGARLEVDADLCRALKKLQRIECFQVGIVVTPPVGATGLNETVTTVFCTKDEPLARRWALSLLRASESVAEQIVREDAVERRAKA